MNKLSILGLSLAVIATLSLNGCGSSSSSDNESINEETPSINDTQTISGKVADGYLDNAKVCLDKNLNGQCDSDEPNTLSVNGNYDLNITLTDVGKYPILVEVTTQTKDLDDGNFITKPYILTAPKDSTTFISPITTLIKSQIDNNPALTTQEATLIVSKELNITLSDSLLLSDYIENENTDLVSKQLHEVGKVLAKLIVDIEENIKTTLGLTDISDNQRAGLSKLVNDIALENINSIANKIKDDNKSISELTSDLDTIVQDNNTTLNDLDIETKKLLLLQNSITLTMQEALNIEFYSLDTDNGKISVKGNKFTTDNKLYGQESILDERDNNIEYISTNMQFDEEFDLLANGSIQFKEDNQAIIERLSKIDLSLKTYTLEEILLMLSTNEYSVLKVFQEKGITIDSEKLSTNILFDTGDILYFWVVNRHEEGITNQNFTNNSAMLKIINVLKD